MGSVNDINNYLWEDGTIEEINCRWIPEETFEVILGWEPRSKFMAFKSLTLPKNNNRTYHCYVKDRNLNYINVDGCIGIMTWKNSDNTSDILIKKSTNVSGEGEIGAPEKGEMYFYIQPSDTDPLDDNEQYQFDITLIKNGKQYTVMQGVITLQKITNYP